MSKAQQPRMSPLGAGIRLLWAWREVTEGRVISSTQLASEARAKLGPVSPSSPLSVVLGREVGAAELSRILKYFRCQQDDAERIGSGDLEWLKTVAEEWP